MPIHSQNQREIKRVYLKYAYKTMYGQIVEFDRELTIKERDNNYFRENLPGIKRAPEHDKYVDIEECDEMYGGRITLTRDQIVAGGVYMNKKYDNNAFRVKEINGLELLVEILWIEYRIGKIESVVMLHNECIKYNDIELNHFIKIEDPVKTELAKEFKTTSGDDMLALGEG